MKYSFIIIPSSFGFTSTQLGVSAFISSLFCKNIISDVTFVFAFFIKVLFGSLIAPIRSALCDIYFLNSLLVLSRVPLLVTKAITPPVRNLSRVFAIK